MPAFTRLTSNNPRVYIQCNPSSRKMMLNKVEEWRYLTYCIRKCQSKCTARHTASDPNSLLTVAVRKVRGQEIRSQALSGYHELFMNSWPTWTVLCKSSHTYHVLCKTATSKIDHPCIATKRKCRLVPLLPCDMRRFNAFSVSRTRVLLVTQANA